MIVIEEGDEGSKVVAIVIVGVIERKHTGRHQLV